MKYLLSFLCVLLSVSCFAATEERILQLPQDQAKWYISVVGDAHDVQYGEILGWFDADPMLSSLKNQVKFCKVTTDTATYRERYEPNIQGTPTVRVQTNDGTVVYEASSGAIPRSAASLYEAIRLASAPKACPDGYCPFRPSPSPHVTPEPPPVLPEPPPIDDGGAPVFVTPVVPEEPAAPSGDLAWIWILAVSLSVVAGAALGISVQWRKTYGR